MGLEEEGSSHNQTCAMRSLRQGQHKVVQQLISQLVKMSGRAIISCYLYKILFNKNAKHHESQDNSRITIYFLC